ncbi:PREDICTED: protein brambleberry-like [Dufourea novaeangliae]|uniref:protein brambleberry-like n=1 Tax=Dufourea novaeangliae TaxID=178035 RepID=UPI00076708FD|nr:PREDICTED: protein brambleberry-like [Dufourea novaeangliae]
MELGYLLTLLVMSITCQAEANSMFGWIWGKANEESTVLVADGVPLVAIPYESMTEDEKFLQEAAKFTEIQVSSPLETCQHKVIMKIRTSCSEMTEEQLAKLSVNLLNCQAAVEGRKMFPCTEEMSLKQCTTDMDADMWNAYHLMSNRARAVCYAARGTQFRALTELTVNKLMQTAHTQIKTLGSLKESQDRLEEQTVQALDSLSKGNEALLEQQQHLKDAQASAQKLVTSNLRELSNEKALIRMGHAQLAVMAEDIKNKLAEASKSLEDQAVEHSNNHKEILEDLTNIQEQAQFIWDKIETSTNRIFEQHEEALVQYEQTLEKLAQINDTIQFLWNITNTMRAEVDQKLNWLTNYIGDTGEQMHKMYCTGLHVVYLLCAMIIAAFLHAPFITRLTIMGLVPLNLLSYLKHGMEACLDFTSMTVLIFLITTMHFLMTGIQRICGPKAKTVRSEPVQIINENGPVNGAVHSYVSSSANTQSLRESSMSLYSKLKRNTRNVYNAIYNQTNHCIQKSGALLQSAVSWSRQSFTQREELSCSYVPSKKQREDLVYNYHREFPSMISDDVTDFENSNVMSERNDSTDDLDNLIDANELRRRLRRVEGSLSRSSRVPGSPSRSVTPSYASSRMLCNAMTKSGRKCRIVASVGHQFCTRHKNGSSIFGD